MNFAQLTEDLDIFDIRHIRHIFQALPFSLCLPFIFLFRSDSNILDSAFIWFDIVFFSGSRKVHVGGGCINMSCGVCCRRVYKYGAIER